MSAPYADLTTDDYLSAAQKLLPQGPAWPRDPNTIFGKFLSSLAECIWRGHRALADLFDRELDPTQTFDLLPDWEDAFGITRRGSLTRRRLNLLAVIGDDGGFTAAHYEARAAAAGITITAERTGPFLWTVYGDGALLPAARAALEEVINLNNRATCVVTFVYDYGLGGKLDFSDPSNANLNTVV